MYQAKREAGSKRPYHYYGLIAIFVVGVILVSSLAISYKVLFKGEELAAETPRTVPTAQVASVATTTASPARNTSRARSPRVNTAAIEEEVKAVLEGWAAASRNHNLEEHMSYYAETLNVYYRRSAVSQTDVRGDRERAFTKYSSLSVELSNITVQVASGGQTATAVLDKTWNFAGEKNSSGSVQQKVWLANVSGRWLITGEKDLKVYYTNW